MALRSGVMGTAIVVAIVSGVVSLVSVLLNAFITTANLRAEAKRARDVREDEAKRRQEDHAAEAARRASERDAEAVRAAAAAHSARVQQRVEAVQLVIDQEVFVRANANWQSIAKLATAMERLSLLTHPEEANLRAGLRRRVEGAGGSAQAALMGPQWWYPWVSAWMAHPDEPMVNGDSDVGRAF